jgi:preprotein translocase subunit SecD
MVGRRLCLTTLCLLIAWGLVGCAPQASASAPHTTLAQSGGLRVIVRLECPAGQDCGTFSKQLAQTTVALAARAQRGLGVQGASATALKGNEVQIDLPGYTDQQLAESALTAQGVAQFIDTGGNPLQVGTTVAAHQYPVLFTGAQIDPNSIQATLDQNNAPIVVFEFQGAARSQFATYTRENAGNYLTITVDGVVVESATIQSEIDGQAEITGSQSMVAAQALAAELKSPPLPDPVSLVSAQKFGA